MEHAFTLRPHHGMCISFFVGKGYSDDFTAHMASIINVLSEDPLICLSSTTDVICKKCPNNTDGVCTTDEKAAQYDREVLKRCKLEDGVCMRYSDFSQLVHKHILHRGLREEICGDCQWSALCR